MGSQRFKITYLVDFFRTVNAGTEKQLGYLLKHLPRAGHAVELISLQDSPFLAEEARIQFPGVVIRSLGASSDLSRSPLALARLFRILRRTHPDLVHTFFPTSNSLGVMVARLSGVKRIISSRRDLGYHLTRKDILLLRLANRFVCRVVANSLAVRDRAIAMEGLSRHKIAVIYNGIDSGECVTSSAASEKREPIVGIVANLNRPVKRVDLFVRAAARVHAVRPDVRFWVIGDGYLRPDLERLASTLGLNSSLQFLGRRSDVHELLERIRIGVICSDSEGLSNAIMEYMAAGLQVVATNVGGNPELVCHRNIGQLVPPNDSKVLAESIIAILNSPEEAEKSGLAAHTFISENFSIQGMIRKTMLLYSNLIPPFVRQNGFRS